MVREGNPPAERFPANRGTEGRSRAAQLNFSRLSRPAYPDVMEMSAILPRTGRIELRWYREKALFRP